MRPIAFEFGQSQPGDRPQPEAAAIPARAVAWPGLVVRPVVDTAQRFFETLAPGLAPGGPLRARRLDVGASASLPTSHSPQARRRGEQRGEQSRSSARTAQL